MADCTVPVVARTSTLLRWTLTSRVLAFTGRLVAASSGRNSTCWLFQVCPSVDHRGGEAVHRSVSAHRRDGARPRVALVSSSICSLLLFGTLWSSSTGLRR